MVALGKSDSHIIDHQRNVENWKCFSNEEKKREKLKEYEIFFSSGAIMVYFLFPSESVV